ncbi:MAG: ribbon-helix-helix protein, CopG family [Actinobacteria bacterium]|nr:ribbon-helix-helix protein, CopG family [Actinomycetota bacterium]
MAMTLRLDENQTEALRRCADEEGRSMQEVAKRAIEQYVSKRDQRLASAITLVATRDAELLDRLSR